MTLQDKIDNLKETNQKLRKEIAELQAANGLMKIENENLAIDNDHLKVGIDNQKSHLAEAEGKIKAALKDQDHQKFLHAREIREIQYKLERAEMEAKNWLYQYNQLNEMYAGEKKLKDTETRVWRECFTLATRNS